MSSELEEGSSMDITGMIGQYAHGNEPSHHTAYMYAYAGEQYKIAKNVRHILTEFYTAQPDGLIGNEDCGQMSAWYIFSPFLVKSQHLLHCSSFSYSDSFFI